MVNVVKKYFVILLFSKLCHRSPSYVPFSNDHIRRVPTREGIIFFSNPPHLRRKKCCINNVSRLDTQTYLSRHQRRPLAAVWRSSLSAMSMTFSTPRSSCSERKGPGRPPASRKTELGHVLAAGPSNIPAGLSTTSMPLIEDKVAERRKSDRETDLRRDLWTDRTCIAA